MTVIGPALEVLRGQVKMTHITGDEEIEFNLQSIVTKTTVTPQSTDIKIEADPHETAIEIEAALRTNTTTPAPPHHPAIIEIEAAPAPAPAPTTTATSETSIPVSAPLLPTTTTTTIKTVLIQPETETETETDNKIIIKYDDPFHPFLIPPPNPPLFFSLLSSSPLFFPSTFLSKPSLSPKPSSFPLLPHFLSFFRGEKGKGEGEGADSRLGIKR